MWVADKTCRKMHGGVFGILAITGALAALNHPVRDRELHLHIGVTAGLSIRWDGGEGGDRGVGQRHAGGGTQQR